MTSNNLFAFLLLVIVATARQEIWIRYEALQQETHVFHKYFHRINYGYFVDLGGFNPIYQSNTIRLSNWDGIIVEASQKRSKNIRDFQPHITSLNFAVSNVSGQMATFYQADFNQASSLSQKAITNIGNMGYKQEKAMVIDMADLCHKYYKAKPNFLNIDLEGIGQIVLKSNDWQNDKCIPDIIYAEDANPNQRAGFFNLEQVVLSHNYTKMDRVVSSTLFIHNSKVQFYKKEAQANAEYLNNKILYTWGEIASALTTMLGKHFYEQFNSKTDLAFPYFRQQSIIDIREINRYSNFISTVGSNRPIVIMQYDEKKSKLFLGTNSFNIQSMTIQNKFNFKKITADYSGEKLIIYVFDHQKYDQFNVILLENQINKPCDIQQKASNQVDKYTPKEQNQVCSNDNKKYELIIAELKRFLTITVSLLVVFMIIFICIVEKRLTKPRLFRYNNGSINVPQTQIKQTSSSQL